MTVDQKKTEERVREAVWVFERLDHPDIEGNLPREELLQEVDLVGPRSEKKWNHVERDQSERDEMQEPQLAEPRVSAAQRQRVEVRERAEGVEQWLRHPDPMGERLVPPAGIVGARENEQREADHGDGKDPVGKRVRVSREEHRGQKEPLGRAQDHDQAQARRELHVRRLSEPRRKNAAFYTHAGQAVNRRFRGQRAGPATTRSTPPLRSALRESTGQNQAAVARAAPSRARGKCNPVATMGPRSN